MPPREESRPDLRDEVADIKLMVKEIRTVLLGVPESEEKGLCGEVKELSKSHYDLRKTVYTVIAFMVGSGLLTGAGFGISELVKLK